jgi:hypothetical protein
LRESLHPPTGTRHECRQRQRQKSGLITYSRGRLAIINRKGLEASACECYEIVRQETERLLKA